HRYGMCSIPRRKDGARTGIRNSNTAVDKARGCHLPKEACVIGTCSRFQPIRLNRPDSAGHLLARQMSNRNPSRRYDLRRIAHDAMLQHGLLPDFTADALAETERISVAAERSSPEIRDLRNLLWASIDNDDSRDLDQLSV